MRQKIEYIFSWPSLGQVPRERVLLCHSVSQSWLETIELGPRIRRFWRRLGDT